MTKSLNDYIRENSKSLKIADGETVEVIYKGYEIIPDKFNPGKKTVSYQFHLPGSGSLVPWNKSSNRVAAQMARLEVGDTIRITRFGEGMETKYRIVKAGVKAPDSSVKESPGEALFPGGLADVAESNDEQIPF